MSESIIITGIASVSYLLASLILFFCITRQCNKGSILGAYCFFAILALALHAYRLYHAVLLAQVGLDLGFYNALSLILWLSSMMVVLGSTIKPANGLLLFLYPLSACVLWGQLAFHQGHIVYTPSSLGMQIHILLSVVAYSLLTIGALQSLFLYAQEYALRNGHFIRILNIIPPMQIMEDLLVRIIWVGFFMLSLSLTSGMMFLHDIFEQHLVHKTVLSIIAWFIYGGLLYGRWRAGWRGTTITHWVLGGFIALMLAYLGTKLVLEMILQVAHP